MKRESEEVVTRGVLNGCSNITTQLYIWPLFEELIDCVESFSDVFTWLWQRLSRTQLVSFATTSWSVWRTTIKQFASK